MRKTMKLSEEPKKETARAIDRPAKVEDPKLKEIERRLDDIDAKVSRALEHIGLR
jgi:hypothetical protein